MTALASSRSRGSRVLAALAALLLLLLLALGASASAQAAPPGDEDPTTQAGDEASAASETDDDAIELDERGRVVVAEPSEEAMRWYRSGNVLWIVELLWGLLIPGLILFTGFSAKLRDWGERLGRERLFWSACAYVLLYSLVVFVVDLPLNYYADYLRPHAYGLSSQSFGKWIGDAGKTLALGVVLGAPCVAGTLFFIHKSPERWWIWTSLVAVPLAFALLMLAPVFIAPLFNDFGPMRDASLEAEILALAERAGIEGGRVFEVDKSVDTKQVNAYVTGFGATKRIVLWDTIIARLDRNELLVVMGHEMGHYVLGHVVNSMIILTFTIPLSLWAFHKLAKLIIARNRRRFGFTTLGDVAALPLFFVLIGLFGLVGAPLANAWSRHQEHESDRFALEITHDNLGCAKAFAKLQQSNLGNPRPGPLFVLWRASHPPLGERIDFCNDYRPWETGEAQVYEDLFEAPVE